MSTGSPIRQRTPRGVAFSLVTSAPPASLARTPRFETRLCQAGLPGTRSGLKKSDAPSDSGGRGAWPLSFPARYSKRVRRFFVTAIPVTNFVLWMGKLFSARSRGSPAFYGRASREGIAPFRGLGALQTVRLRTGRFRQRHKRAVMFPLPARAASEPGRG